MNYNYPIISNCTIVGNIQQGILGDMPTITNSIIYYNGSDCNDVQIESNFAAVTYSDIQGGWSGIGNIDTEPCFISLGYWARAENAEKVVQEQRELAEERAEDYRSALYCNRIALADVSYRDGNLLPSGGLLLPGLFCSAAHHDTGHQAHDDETKRKSKRYENIFIWIHYSDRLLGPGFISRF